MKIKSKIVISLTLSVLMIFMCLSSASATESDWQNLTPDVLESGLSGTVHNCSPLTVTNGSVAAYPSCTITCNSGYTLSGSSCVASSSSSSASSSGSSAYVAPSLPSTTLSGESVTINYAEEATLTKTFSDNSKIVIEIPICTVEVETTFDVEQKSLVNYETPVATVGAILVGNTVFEITAVDAENMAVTSFYRAITITITIPDLPEDTSNLGLYYYNNGTDSWGLIPGTQFDTVTGQVTFTTDHFTKFAVFEITGTPYFLSVDLSLKGVGTIAENALVKTSESPAVYLIENSKRRLITSAEIFLAKGYKWGDILVVSQAEMDNYAIGTAVTIDEVIEPVGTLSDGMLVRKQGTYGVYLIHNNEKRPIKSAEIFLGRGYKWGDVVDIEQSVLDLYTLGEDVAISEDITTQLQTITINTSRLRVRSLAGLEGDIITLVLKGQIYSVLAEQNGWYQINYESGKTGWVMGIYAILNDSSVTGLESSITINTPRLRVRNLASLEGKIIAIVLEGQEYSALSQQDGWYKINYESGKTGWVMGMYVIKQ